MGVNECVGVGERGKTNNECVITTSVSNLVCSHVRMCLPTVFPVTSAGSGLSATGLKMNSEGFEASRQCPLSYTAQAPYSPPPPHTHPHTHTHIL